MLYLNNVCISPWYIKPSWLIGHKNSSSSSFLMEKLPTSDMNWTEKVTFCLKLGYDLAKTESLCINSVKENASAMFFVKSGNSHCLPWLHKKCCFKKQKQNYIFFIVVYSWFLLNIWQFDWIQIQNFMLLWS